MCRCCAQIIPISDNGELSEAFNARLEEQFVLDMKLLHGTERPMLAVLYKDVKGGRHVKTYTLLLDGKVWQGSGIGAYRSGFLWGSGVSGISVSFVTHGGFSGDGGGPLEPPQLTKLRRATEATEPMQLTNQRIQINEQVYDIVGNITS